MPGVKEAGYTIDDSRVVLKRNPYEKKDKVKVKNRGWLSGKTVRKTDRTDQKKRLVT